MRLPTPPEDYPTYYERAYGRLSFKPRVQDGIYLKIGRWEASGWKAWAWLTGVYFAGITLPVLTTAFWTWVLK